MGYDGKTQEPTSGPPQRVSSPVPSISLPKGGGAIHGMGEKFAANPVTGTGSMSIPIATSPGRSGFGPQLSLSYDSGAGNGPYGLGWSLALLSITRKTDKGLPKYEDADDSDVFVLSGAEDLVPMMVKSGTDWIRENLRTRTVSGTIYVIQRYRPRTEGLFARIEHWTDTTTGIAHWRSISKDNITTLYGKTSESRIADPSDATRIFSWLICASFDDKGNALRYDYKAEDSDGIDLAHVHEKNRSTSIRSTNRYLKRILYGNLTPLKSNADLSTFTYWMFEAVLDYGEHDVASVNPHTEAKPWPVRNDPFSTYRSGFEVRTYRLCQRVLMFHHFPDEAEVGDNCLVRSTDLTFSHQVNPADARNPIYSLILAATQTGYKRRPSPATGFSKQSLPPVEFTYTEATIQADVRSVDPASLENAPAGLDSSRWQWVDLDSEGLSGILSEQGGGWFYKRNTSPNNLVGTNGSARVEARFAPLELVATKPALSLAGDHAQFMDLAGNGQLDVVNFAGLTPGFYERTQDLQWDNFTTFRSLPALDWSDPNLKFVDLTGDGHADLLISEEEIFHWHPSLAEQGFGSRETTRQSHDEERGPRIVFADGAQSIFLADMSGDGLTDLVRIRNGEVCYWPNIGYGRFGAKVTMDRSPWFDHPDRFDQKRIQLADVDGSGLIDIIYLHRDGVRIYWNQSGNAWSPAPTVPFFPRINDHTSVTVLDLLGNGTACLVWSSPLPGDTRNPMRYIDLMGGQKPHLLVKTVNNLGAETVMHYAPSTKFYLQDQYAGNPWITKLPFPVHVVERVETIDHISRNRFVTRYAYHHGYFDGVEREFRGFGMVEQWDTEEIEALTGPTGGTNLDASSAVPPVHTKTWFHTGVYVGRQHISNFFSGLLTSDDEGEYYREPDLTDAQARALLLEDTVLPNGLSVNEEREACRSLKGSMLRQEVYALDGSEREPHPYTVTEQNFTIRVLQPRGSNRHAVFLSHAREAISYHYERNSADPRISHALTLAVDDFGNVLQSATIAYGRRTADATLPADDQKKQTQTLITFTDAAFTNAITLEDDDYRSPLPAEVRTFELTGLSLPAGSPRFSLTEISNAIATATKIQYEETATHSTPEKRLIEHARTLYRKNDLTSALPFGVAESLALPFESYKLAFTSGLISSVYGSRVTDAMLASEGGYVHSEGDTGWWSPSGHSFFTTNPADTVATELTTAQQHFFLPKRYRDPFGHDSITIFDPYDLLMIKTQDALGNRVTVETNDYRVLQPRLVSDPNANQTEVAFDTLGMVAGTAVMGKPLPAPAEGDSLAGFKADLTQTQLDAFHDAADPRTLASDLLRDATTRIIYDLHRFQRTQAAHPTDPAQWLAPYAATLARETHVSDLSPAQASRIQLSFSYSDGFGREIQKKIQAEPEKTNGIAGPPRWVGSGWTIFNNKGKPVRQFEPFFTATHHFEFGVQIGVSPILFYDPLDRVVATLHPNHTWEKVVFDPWRQETWDVNDTVLIADPKLDADVGGFFARLPTAAYSPSWHTTMSTSADANERNAALRTAPHAATPTIAHFDTLGRPFLTIADNGTIGKYETRVELDIEGNQRNVTDALGRIVMRYDYSIAGPEKDKETASRIHQSSMEAGERWMLNDVAGKPIRAWDTHGHSFRTVYDDLRRPLESYMQPTATDPEIMVGRTLYGEHQSNPEATNLRTRPIEQCDQAGEVTTDAFDFKGNALRSQRQIAVEYKLALDWSGTVPLEPEIYTTSTQFDALNRPTEVTTPDSSVLRPSHNEANLLERMEANLRGLKTDNQPVWTPFVKDIDYDAKGQRTRIAYGNGAITRYEHDAQTFRLTRLLTTIPDSSAAQDLHYTYDPTGNITHIRDDAHQTIYFKNQVVAPESDYTYDALYRLIKATGREHIGQVGQPTPSSWDEEFRVNLPQPGDGQAMRNYTEKYLYDAVGNFLELAHKATAGNWTRAYAYASPSLIEPTKVNNRLTSTSVGSEVSNYTHDNHGNMVMPHLTRMEWNFRDQLAATARQYVTNGTPEITYYTYDAAGERVRKVTERQNGTRKDERLYLGGYELYHEFDHTGTSIALARETLHIMDDKQRIALIETRTQGNDETPVQLIRYQFSNHLGSASLELDAAAQVISYEEYTPYGSTAYQAVNATIKAAAKRYRYTGKERDEETGLAYHSARYFAPWLGRWASCDPIGIGDGTQIYCYCACNPVKHSDSSGLCGVSGGDDPVKGSKLAKGIDLEEVTIKAFPDSEPTANPPPTFCSRTNASLISPSLDIKATPTYGAMPTGNISYTYVGDDFMAINANGSSSIISSYGEFSYHFDRGEFSDAFYFGAKNLDFSLEKEGAPVAKIISKGIQWTTGDLSTHIGIIATGEKIDFFDEGTGNVKVSKWERVLAIPKAAEGFSSIGGASIKIMGVGIAKWADWANGDFKPSDILDVISIESYNSNTGPLKIDYLDNESDLYGAKLTGWTKKAAEAVENLMKSAADNALQTKKDSVPVKLLYLPQTF